METFGQKNRDLLDTASKENAGIIIIQNDDEKKGLIKYVNDVAADLTGYSREQLLKMNLMDLIHPYNYEDDWKGHKVPHSGDNGPVTHQFWVFNKKGKKVPIETSISFTEFEGKKALVWYARDITEKLKADQQLKNYSQNLEKMVEERATELKKALLDLQNTQSQLLQSEKMASIGQLAAGVAHEINNPVGFVRSNLGTINEYLGDLMTLIDQYQRLEATLGKEKGMPESGAIQEALENIQKVKGEIGLDYILDDYKNVVDESLEGMARVGKIVSDLKDFAHMDKANELELTDLNKGLVSTLNIVWNELKYKAEVIKDLGDIPLVQCYPQRINQVFMNILVNAAQAIEEKGEIHITTIGDNDHVEIRIRDNGSGIKKEILTKIFDPFFTTKEVGKGTGLGLNVAYNIIQRHKGTIEVESEVGKGTTFIIRLQIEPELESNP